MKSDKINEIEENLLMIFLSDLYEEKLRIEDIEFYQSGKGFLWESFKKEELGRTLPEEFEFYVSDWAIKEIKSRKTLAIATCLWMDQWNKCKNKIKITVVNE